MNIVKPIDWQDPDKLRCVKCNNVGFTITYEPRSVKIAVSGEHLRYECRRCKFPVVCRCHDNTGRKD